MNSVRGVMLSVICLLIVFGFSSANYDCLCSYDVEKPVLDLPTRSSQTIGYMYEFDCKPIVKVNGTDTKTWTALAFEKQLGYVEMNGQLQVQICPGDPSPTDAITTLSPTTTSNIRTMSVYTTKLSTHFHSQTHSHSTNTLPTSVPSSHSSTSIATTKMTTSTLAPTTTTIKPTAVPIKTTQSSTVTTNLTTLLVKKITTTVFQTFPSSIKTTSNNLMTSTDTTKSSLPKTAISATQSTFPTTSIKSTTNTTNTYSRMPFTTRQPSAATTTTLLTVPMTRRHLSTSTRSSTSQSTMSSTTQQSSTISTTTQSTLPTSHRQSTLTVTTKSSTPTTHLPTTSSPTIRTTQTTMTATQPTKMLTAFLGNTTLCPSSVVQYAQQDGEILTQNGDSCYTIVPHKVSWSHAEGVCNYRGGHLFHVRNAGENLFFYITLNTRFNHSVWMGLHDTIAEEHFQWTSGAPLSYINWIPGRKNNFMNHNVEDCAVFIPYKDHGKWDDIVCGANSPIFEDKMEEHYFICQFPTRNPMPAVQQVTSGDLNLCSSHLRYYAQMQGNHLGQYGSSCYEQVPLRGTWYDADQDCRRKGGHLLQISGPQEESYIQTFLTYVDSQHAVWIGLHDQRHEEIFTWTSGEPLTYTNWLPGRRSNFFSHSVEDCVAMMPYKQGQWDDVPCGGLLVQSSSGLRQRVEKHPHICEFYAVSSGGPSLIGK